MVYGAKGRGTLHSGMGARHPLLWHLFQADGPNEAKIMSKQFLLYVGIVVFGLMMIGLFLTAREFKDLTKHSSNDSQS